MKPIIYNYFDHIYCISLKRRTDRRESFLKNLPYLGLAEIEYWDAVDALEIEVPTDWGYSKPLYAVTQSHAAVLKDAIDKGYNSILVFEDDAVVAKEFQQMAFEIMDCLKTQSWDLVVWGYLNREEPIKLHSKYLKLTKNLHAHAISYSYIGMRKMHEHFLQSKWPSDYTMGEKMREMNVYGPLKNLVIQSGGYSDIEGKDTFQFYSKPIAKIKTLVRKVTNKIKQ